MATIRTPSCTLIPISRCSTVLRRRTTWSSAPRRWGWRRSPPPTARALRRGQLRHGRRGARPPRRGRRRDRTARRGGPGSGRRRHPASTSASGAADGRPRRHGPTVRGRPAPRPRPERARLPGHRDPSRRTCAASASAQRGPHLVLLARNATGCRCSRGSSAGRTWPGTKTVPHSTMPSSRRTTRGSLRSRVVATATSRAGCGRRSRGRASGRRDLRPWFGGSDAAGGSAARRDFFIELQHHLLPDDDWLVAESARLAAELGLPVVVTNDVHYAFPRPRAARRADRHLPRPLARHARRPASARRRIVPEVRRRTARAGAPPTSATPRAEGIANSVELARSCSVDLGFERYRFPGFPVPSGETPFSHLARSARTAPAPAITR